MRARSKPHPLFEPSRLFALAAALALTLAGATALADPDEASLREAGRHFDQGTTLYNEGKFAEALKEFNEANRLAPHPSTLFSIARCHENLGQVQRALEVYRRALGEAKDAAMRRDLEGRVERLEKRPVKVFVTSIPPGARVTVGGRAEPEPGVTPSVLEIPPGEHVLVVRREGSQIAVRRIVIEPGRELPVDVTLDATPSSEGAACPAKGSSSCPDLRLVPSGNFRLQFGVGMSLAVLASRPFSGGLGVQVYSNYRRFFFGGQFQAHTIMSEHITPTKYNDLEADAATFSWLFAQLEGGYMVPFRTCFVFGTIGLGMAYDRLKFNGWRLDKDFNTTTTPHSLTNEQVGFAWSVGGGINVMATSWFSVGASVRFGMIHGHRIDFESPPNFLGSTNFPFASLSLALTFHI
jgi:hypothetical protein